MPTNSSLEIKKLCDVIDQLMQGNTKSRIEEPFSDKDMEALRQKINAYFETQEKLAEEYHLFNMEMAYAISDWLEALEEVNRGNLEVFIEGSYKEDFVNKITNALNITFATLREKAKEEERKRQLQQLADQQAKVIEELSTPIIKVWDSVLVLPVIGIVDSKRAEEMMEKLLFKVVEEQIHYTIVDLTGVTAIDTRTVGFFLQMVKASMLIGTNCIVSGISPTIAQTITKMGLEFPVLTMRDLRDALKHVFNEIGLQIVSKEQ
ncbi:MAG: STAS domain-containing protein [Acidobacteriota bacterium]